MGKFFDKIKNVMFETEVYDDGKDEEVKQVVIEEPVEIKEETKVIEEVYSEILSEKKEEAIPYKKDDSFITLNKKEPIEEIKKVEEPTFEKKETIKTPYKPTKIISPVYGVIEAFSNDLEAAKEQPKVYVSKTIVSPVYGKIQYSIDTNRIDSEEVKQEANIQINDIEEEPIEKENENQVDNYDVKPSQPFEQIIPESFKNIEVKNETISENVEKKTEDYENISIFDLGV